MSPTKKLTLHLIYKAGMKLIQDLTNLTQVTQMKIPKTSNQG